MSMCQQIFREEKLDLWLRPYTILVVGDQAGKPSNLLLLLHYSFAGLSRFMGGYHMNAN